MNVLIFSTAYLPHVGGAEVAVKEITDRLRDIEFDLITVRLDRKDAYREKIGNINVYRIGYGLGKIDKLLFPFRAARLAGRLHKKENYQVAWSIMASFSGFAALFFKKKHSEVKFLLTLQEGDDIKDILRKTAFVKGWFKQIFTRADYIQCISSHLKKWALQMGATCSVEVVPNGVAFQKIQNPKSKIQRNSKSQIINSKTVLTTSRLVKKNGVEDLIKAMSLLDDSYKLLIVGDGEESQKLKVKSRKLKVDNRVQFVGSVEHKELAKYYESADVFCRPSLTEGLGNSFLEAMVAELPVIATPVGGIPDFLQDSKTGWFCRVRNPESIADRIKYILDEKNSDAVVKVVNNAKQMVQARYTWDVVVPKIKNIFQKL